MQFMVLRRSDRRSESGAATAALPGGQALRSSAGSARMRRHNGVWALSEGPFDSSELVAGFTMVNAASKQAALDQVRQWVLDDDAAELEIRATGCPGGCHGIDEHGTAAGTLPRRRPELKPYVVLIRSDALSEQDLAPPPELIDVMNARNEADVRAGVLLAGSGLQSSASGVRLRFGGADGGGKVSIIDGPFTEVKELIAGFWMVQAASRAEVEQWVRGYPFPQGGDIVLELRELAEPAAPGLSPELLQAEQRMRSQALESGLQAALARAGGR